ncbi:hypothetical protein [Jatrophihabitans lederbergiae]|uniref:Uncharacterized protein n=1 Tax=Jatrophihabitans lederbergiae TaxID=3075547 RepID=A0ABU2JJ15_9ACTN|nr:hypothetical protein [Jatrophihabitans sp. DSM 44399]MDT0264233.1 hypothetical protein [Jatrophihabitans sp. DSM 44399]
MATLSERAMKQLLPTSPCRISATSGSPAEIVTRGRSRMLVNRPPPPWSSSVMTAVRRVGVLIDDDPGLLREMRGAAVLTAVDGAGVQRVVDALAAFHLLGCGTHQEASAEVLRRAGVSRPKS